MPSLRNRLARWRITRDHLRGTTTLFVDAGVVPCPDQGDVSIELCLGCPHLRGVECDPAVRIRCHPGLARTVQHLSPAGG